jgi:hypothetical protein
MAGGCSSPVGAWVVDTCINICGCGERCSCQQRKDWLGKSKTTRTSAAANVILVQEASIASAVATGSSIHSRRW